VTEARLAVTPKPGFLGKINHFRNQSETRNPICLMQRQQSPLLSSLAQQIVAANPVTALSSIEGVSGRIIENSADGTCVKAKALQSPL
jgi:hypothetical protein